MVQLTHNHGTVNSMRPIATSTVTLSCKIQYKSFHSSFVHAESSKLQSRDVSVIHCMWHTQILKERIGYTAFSWIVLSNTPWFLHGITQRRNEHHRLQKPEGIWEGCCVVTMKRVLDEEEKSSLWKRDFPSKMELYAAVVTYLHSQGKACFVARSNTSTINIKCTEPSCEVSFLSWNVFVVAQALILWHSSLCGVASKAMVVGKWVHSVTITHVMKWIHQIATKGLVDIEERWSWLQLLNLHPCMNHLGGVETRDHFANQYQKVAQACLWGHL